MMTLEEQKLREEILRLHIRLAMMDQAYTELSNNVTRAVTELAKKIPVEGEVRKWVIDQNEESKRMSEMHIGAAVQSFINLKKEMDVELERIKNG